ncbi:MAG: LysR family transcriptional regulator [Pseudomonadota bacterium]
MDAAQQDIRFRLRLYFGDDLMFGPGKADLLQGIAELGSISAAGRRMAMSYKRAWMLVEDMNAAFKAPLVESSRGGPAGGGARLTEAGKAVLAQYRALEAIVPQAGAAQIAGIQAMLKQDMSGGK